jgi:trk system potassium uptake protein TrkH
MRFSHVVSALGAMLRLFSFAFLAPILVAFLYEPRDLVLAGVAVPSNVFPFVASFLLINAIALPIKFLTREAEEEEMSDREGYLTAGLLWLVMPLFGMVPFLATGLFSAPLDAYFEAVSGLTTSGFTALPIAADDVAPSLTLWRAFLQWVGGIGIVVVSLAIISRLTHGGVRLFHAESAAHAAKRLRPKLADTARVLIRLYGLFSVVLALILFAAILRTGMPWKTAALDAVVHMMTAFSTGGFSSHFSSAMFFDDILVEGVLILTMLAGATNFHLLIALRAGNWRAVVRDGEWRFFMGTLAVAGGLVVAGLVLSGEGVRYALRHGVFATVSIFTTTGLNTVDWSGWPTAVLFLLLLGMFIGAQAGSTTGAIKAFRVFLLVKVLQRQLVRLLHPRAVVPVRIGQRVIPEEAIATATAFIFTYVLLWIAGCLAIAALEPDLAAMEVVSASAASLGNVGNGFGAFGPSGSIAALGEATKAVMIVLMWFGRLEVFTALLLFAPSTWRN